MRKTETPQPSTPTKSGKTPKLHQRRVGVRYEQQQTTMDFIIGGSL